MRKIVIQTSLLLLTVVLFSSCNQIAQYEDKARMINNYEKAALGLSKENRGLRIEISKLKYEIQSLKSKNNFLAMQLEKSKGRSIASIPPVVSPKNDLVKFDTYKWTAQQMYATAESEFESKNFEKAAQFFQTFKIRYPKHERVDDQFLFQSGLAAFESGKHYDWALENLERIIAEYPTSKYYRGAKLWTALTRLKLGDKDSFFGTVEEFRKKYRNTPEWKILSSHYEKILQEYKK